MKKKIFLLIVAFLATSLYLFTNTKTLAVNYLPSGTKTKITSYWPGGGGVEGPDVTSKAGFGPTGAWRKGDNIPINPETGKPFPVGTGRPNTLQMLRKGETTYVTLAADPSHYGEWHLIPKITWTEPDGQTYTAYNVKAMVNDTGGTGPTEFRVLKSDSPEVKAFKLSHYDVAVAKGDVSAGKTGNYLDAQMRKKGTTLEGQNIILEPTSATANTPPTTFEVGKGTGAGKPAQPSEPAQQTQTATQSAGQTTSSNYSSGGSGSSGGKVSPWSSSNRICYKHTGPASTGFVTTALSCNSGYFCYPIPEPPGFICEPIPDCGPMNALCNSAGPTPGLLDAPFAGCLNYKCKFKPNAIWDMGSKKCGCG